MIWVVMLKSNVVGCPGLDLNETCEPFLISELQAQWSIKQKKMLVASHMLSPVVRT